MEPPEERTVPGAPEHPEPGTIAGAPASSDLDAPADDPDGKEEKKPGHFLKELPVLILIAFGLALLIKTFFAQAFFIPSESMLPTLQINDRVLVNKIVYRIRDPRRGEIVVFVAERDERQRSLLQKVRSFLTEGLGVVRPSEKDFIKRVIGLPGEQIRINERGRVFIRPAGGGKEFRLDEPYLADEKDLTAFGPVSIPEDQYFVMGDNRPNSSDSRKLLGPIDRSSIIGKAFMRIWPPSRLGFFRTPSYDDESAAMRAPPGAPLAPIGGLGVVGVSFGSWSQMVASKPVSARRGSRTSPASMRPAAGRWQGRWSPPR